MDPLSPWGIVLLSGVVLFVTYLSYNALKSVVAAKNSLAELGEGLLVGVLERVAEIKRSQRAFYEYPWTREEARIMLKELRLQLQHRSNIQNMPELAILGPDKARALLTLAVFANVIPSTFEILRRIAFLEEKLNRQQTQSGLSVEG